jgi:predicted dehydrogenase
MGKVHHEAYQSADRAGYDCSVEVVKGIDEVTSHKYDVVSICTPTDSHIELATRAMEAGVNVLLEKPVALRVADIESLIEIEARTGMRCMPAHCMRFWPGWPYARDIISSGVYGAVTSAEFRRLGAVPDWNVGFYHDVNRSGGALFDLHIHDADFVLWCFGEPEQLTSHGNEMHVTAEYCYGDAHVIAEGAWLEGDVPFQMTYRIALEDAALDFSFDRQPALTLLRDGAASPVDVSGPDAYEAQARHFLDVIRGEAVARVTLRDAAAVTRLLTREKEALSR